MNLAEFTELLTDALAVDVEDVNMTFKDGSLIIVVTKVDEDVFEEDEDFDDDEDDEG